MPRAEIDHLEAVRLLRIGENSEAIIAPHLVLRRLLSVLHLRLKLRAVVPVEFAAEGAVGHLTRDALPGQPYLDSVAQVSARLLETPHERTGIEPRGLPALACPLGELRAQGTAAGPFQLRTGHHERQLGRVRDLRAIAREGHNRDVRSAPELLLDELSYRGSDLGFLIQRRAPIADHLLHRRLVADTEAIGTGLADEVRPAFKSHGGVVDGGRIQLGLAQREAQLWKMGHLVGLATRRLEENRGADAPVDVAKRTLGVGVESPAVRLPARDVRLNRGDEPRLAELTEHDTSESGFAEWRRPQGDERLRASLTKTLLRGDRDPLRQHRLERDGKLVGVERTAFADFRARRGNFVPGLHQRLMPSSGTRSSVRR